MRPTAAEIAEAAARLGPAPAQEVLRWALPRFGRRLGVASSFSVEDCVVIDLAHAIDPGVRVFALDTGRLPEETYQTAERVRQKYGIEIEWQFPDRVKVEALLRAKGPFSFMDSLDNRHECCGLRKVEPLGRTLAELDAWVTGLRREQSVTRAETPTVERDEGHGGLCKLNPIIAWSEAQVFAYADERRVPVHPLHKRGYPSIGCAPCTRAIQPGEHPRAGRWWWENPESKECGLHPVKSEA
jgi:phosphoadenosine phosphosulfate reductase